MVTAQDVVEDAWDKSPPAVVIYIIDPFSFATERITSTLPNTTEMQSTNTNRAQ